MHMCVTKKKELGGKKEGKKRSGKLDGDRK
jgi:hypothetical protein